MIGYNAIARNLIAKAEQFIPLYKLPLYPQEKAMYLRGAMNAEIHLMTLVPSLGDQSAKLYDACISLAETSMEKLRSLAEGDNITDAIILQGAIEVCYEMSGMANTSAQEIGDILKAIRKKITDEAEANRQELAAELKVAAEEKKAKEEAIKQRADVADALKQRPPSVLQ